MYDFINGNKFCDLATYSIFPWDGLNWTNEILRKNAIIYVKTDFIQDVFKHLTFSPNKYILITHMSDYSITENLFKNRPACIKKWFAQNAVYNHPDLIPIPIGLENHKGHQRGKFTNHNWVNTNIEILKNNQKDPSIVYCNWNKDNNKERNNIIQSINVEYHWEYGLSFEDYLTNMSKYKFVISPPGNGVDCHRTWEALYLGCIPIVLKHRIYKNFNLPIIQINNWSELTLDLLESFNDRVYNYDELYMSYWEYKILEEFNKL